MALLVAAGCGGGDGGGYVNVMVTNPAAPPIAPFTTCTVTTAEEPAASRSHMDACAEIDYPNYPPSSGDHYGQWAEFRDYDDPVPWGFLVHAMEHGALVLAYNCPSGCPDVLAAFEQVRTRIGADPRCDGDPASRIILVPDPDLDEPIVAVAWERIYRATCIDLPSLEAFATQNYAHGPENLCASGLDGSDGSWCR